MSVIIGLFIVAVLVSIVVYYGFIVENSRLQSLIQCISQIEKYPNSPSEYDNFMILWRQSSSMNPQTFLAGNYYDRILKICNTNSSNILAWQLLKAVVIHFLPSFNENQISETFTLLITSLEKEFKNTPIKKVILEILPLFITDSETSVKFINYWLPKSLVRLVEIDPNLYVINIPLKIDDLKVYGDRSTINFDLIYFKIHQGEFTMGDTNINYNLKELFEIFVESIIGIGSTIFVNMIPRRLIISNNNYRITEISYLKTLYKEFVNMNSEINNLDSEIQKIESLTQVIKDSDAHQHQLVTYKKGLKILKDSRLKAIEIREEYFQFLKERTLNFYLEDLEPDMFKVENKKINWEVKHQNFKEDYDFFKTMIQEYKKLKNN
ncbi:hypothetical protein NWP26_06860 [Chrysosporum ovalisporum APH033B]|uniref:hypothetical protein n=1 Tax=Umezakia ovalisporum TaxID=75695 RepID=UPI0024744FD9|nr:hypothetical protein [Umezakia ovalisporum]MDH6066980.1 hypothetical protein [Umezakia ovalisporum APH033B]